MYKVGVFPGKFLPPHRGHLYAIINAAAKCEQLYVLVSDHPVITNQLCYENCLPLMDMKLRAKWFSQELQGFEHIKVLMLDEDKLALNPYDWAEWFNKLCNIIPEPFEVIFTGEAEYRRYNDLYLPGVVTELFDPDRIRFPISASEIRKHPLKNWDYLLESARQFFAKKVLVAGTESCGKTTMSKYLAKIYHTSCTEEKGRFYSANYLGANEDVFTLKDFERIACQQAEADLLALKNANKVVFYDTDAVITQYYAELYVGQTSPLVEHFIDPTRYDLVLLFTPDVKWVDDGLRWLSQTELRWQLHKRLTQMYLDYGFGDKLMEISGDYQQRFTQCLKLVDQLLER